MKIAVAGTGYVGLVAGVCFAEVGHDVICVDIDENKVQLMKSGKSPIYEKNLEELMMKSYSAEKIDYTTDYKKAYQWADAIFIGVGTPELPDGSADLSGVAVVSKQIAESIEKDCLVVVKSTVPIGTNDKVEQFIKDFLVKDVQVEVASNPEFLAQGSAVFDTLHASRIIIGTESEKAKEMLTKIYQPFGLPMVFVSRKSAEMIKYASNSFLALKISYMNDIASLCELVGADILEVAGGMSYDERIGSKFLNAGIGYGGSCFPKDTKALNYLARQFGYQLKTVEAAVEVNREQKTKLFKKASNRLITFRDLKVAVLGLAFKPGTDDLREAPSLNNIALLLEQGAKIYAYDPVASRNCKKIYPDQIQFTNTPEEALEKANVCFIFTEWKEIKQIAPETYKKLMRTPLVYDGRNIYSLEEMKQNGVEYYSIGRKVERSMVINMREDIKKLDSNQFVFITGVAGFIGFSLSRMLLEQGVPVIGYDNLNSYYEPELKYARLTKLEAYDNFTFIKGNLEQQPIINQLFEQYKPKIVVHLAAQAGVRYSIEKPEEYIQSNILGFFNVLEACRQYPVEHFIFASSSSVYGANEKVPSSTEDKTDCPISLYAATKKSNELMAYTYSHLYNIPATGLRFFTVYGPYGRPDMAYFLFTKAILNEQPIQVYNNGNLYRDFTYIDDVVKIMEKILYTPPIADENKVRYKVYNIGNSKPEKLLYFIETIEKALGKKAQKEYLPMQPGDVYQTFADIHDAVRDFGYSPSTSIEVGLKRFVEWYKDYYNALDFVPPLAAECEDI